MPDSRASRLARTPIIWVVAAAFVLGLVAGFNGYFRGAESLARPVSAVMLIGIGVIILSSRMWFTPSERFDANARLQVALMSAGYLIFGFSQFVSNTPVRFAMGGVALALFLISIWRARRQRSAHA